METFEKLAKVIWLNRQNLQEFGLLSDRKSFSVNKMEPVIKALKTAKRLKTLAANFYLEGTGRNKLNKFIYSLDRFPLLNKLSLR